SRRLADPDAAYDVAMEREDRRSELDDDVELAVRERDPLTDAGGDVGLRLGAHPEGNPDYLRTIRTGCRRERQRAAHTCHDRPNPRFAHQVSTAHESSIRSSCTSTHALPNRCDAVHG